MPGTQVWSEDEATHQIALKSVLGVERTHPDALYQVVTQTPGKSETETIVSTGTHPFYVANRHAFVPADHLRPGDRLVQKDGAFRRVAGVTKTDADRTTTTYNLEVEDFHTYFVGKHGVWVHNSGEPCERMWMLTTWVRDHKAKELGITQDWEILQLTFQTMLMDEKRKDRIQNTEEFIKGAYARFARDFPTGGVSGGKSLHSPPQYIYSTWTNAKKGIIYEMKRAGLQGHHWWPDYLGGEVEEGIVIALSTPFAHTRGIRAMHKQMNLFLGKKLGVKATFKAVEDAFTPLDFATKKAYLKEFYETQGLKMPDFVNSLKPGTL